MWVYEALVIARNLDKPIAILDLQMVFAHIKFSLVLTFKSTHQVVIIPIPSSNLLFEFLYDTLV